MFTIDASYNIAITRGDTATLEITFDGDAPGEEDSVVASVKKSVHRTDEILSRTLERQQDGTYLMTLASEDTADLAFGTYYWDLRVLYADGQVTTPFSPAKFAVCEVVTDLPEGADEP